MVASSRDIQFMNIALSEARKAGAAGEVPVGAVVVKGDQVIATGRNAPIGALDPTAHAEVAALRAAAQILGNYRLDGCELFVTLEPCSMCCGAIVHARLDRVVFGATDPKTGAAGSVINLFAHAQINHRTVVEGGVCAQASSALLQEFFQRQRSENLQLRKLHHPLRDDALRTPDAQFLGLQDYPWPPRYVSDLPALGALRMHYLDQGPVDAARTYLCLHGTPAWSYSYRKMIPVVLQAGQRVVAPDLIGFGKSDKPKKESAHSPAFHRQTLLQLVERLNLERVVLVVSVHDARLGLTLPLAMPDRFAGLLVLDSGSKGFDPDQRMALGNPQLSTAERAAYAAPFPDRGHQAAVRAFAAQLPDAPSASAITREQLRAYWQTHWQAPTMVAFAATRPLVNRPAMDYLQQFMCDWPDTMCLEDGACGVSEISEEVAHRAVQFFGTST